MQPARSLIALALACLATSSLALEPVDPADGLVPVYLFTGVQASDTDNIGIHTAVFCTLYVDTTGLSPFPKVKVEAYDAIGNGYSALDLSPGGFHRSFLFTTGGIAALAGEIALGVPTAAVKGGTMRVLVSKSVARYLQCGAQAMDAVNVVPTYSVALHGARKGTFTFPKVLKP